MASGDKVDAQINQFLHVITKEEPVMSEICIPWGNASRDTDDEGEIGRIHYGLEENKL